MEHKSRRSTRNKKQVRLSSSKTGGAQAGTESAEPSQIDTVEVFNNDLESIGNNDPAQVTSLMSKKVAMIHD